MIKPIEKLRAHNAEFEKKVYQLSNNAYLAVGFAASNVGVIVGNSGLVIIDTTESTKAAENVLAAFREITDKPVETIIYTHSHRDHISGASVFAEDSDVEIIAHHEFTSDLVGNKNKIAPNKALMERTARQFGIGLEDGSERINIGLGPSNRPIEGLGQGHIAPNKHIYSDGKFTTRGGVNLLFTFAPGECADNLIVYLEKDKIVFSADNYYTGFPNLYAIRGTPYRNFEIWADSLAKINKFNASVLAPGHSKPVFGAEQIRERLNDYENAIRHIIEMSAEGMNKGMTPDELVSYVKLPADLKNKPYLQEYYGTVEWSVRAYFAGTLGWFDGDPVNLFPLNPEDEARRFADLIGGQHLLNEAAIEALEKNDPQWALEILKRVLCLSPNHSEAIKTRIRALRMLADQQSNACARNYYLLTAKKEETSLS